MPAELRPDPRSIPGATVGEAPARGTSEAPARGTTAHGPASNGPAGARTGAVAPARDRTPFRRVLVKLSGEGLMGPRDHGLDPETVARLADELKAVRAAGVDVCVVIGGGNIFRGMSGAAAGMERTSADSMGMLATVMNCLAMQSALERGGCPAVVMSAIPMPTVCEPFIRRRAVHHLERGRVVLFAAGTGNPFFTTDTAAALRAIEMDCDVLLKATQVDGVYSADPRKHPDATRYETLSYTEVLARNLQVMDAAAIALARENKLPVLIFSLHAPGALAEVVGGRGRHTIITEEK